MPRQVVAKDSQHLRRLVRATIRRKGPNCDLNHIDVSAVNHFNELFKDTQFNGNVSQWDTRNATVMSGMFMNTPFNGDISKWSTSNVVHMHNMFTGASAFQGNISQWDVSSVSTMGEMFQGSVFQGDVSRWDVSKVRSMNSMFEHSAFHGDVSNWATVSLQNAERMFAGTSFNGDVSKWNTSKLNNVKDMFNTPSFQHDLSAWRLASNASIGNLVHGQYRRGLPKLTSTRDAYANYQHMVGSADFNEYLRSTPFSHVHATFLVASSAQSWWADDATKAWAKEYIEIAQGMGLAQEETIALVLSRYHEKETSCAAEVISLELSSLLQ